ncbi:YkgJ family cysteine cluster protein [Acinetobacter ursingii]|uniref:YkgJ family cysteine cluster protein n=1 Tax=Acinetobacter ursingii TaxID=108980 RepID=UPI003008CB2A
MLDAQVFPCYQCGACCRHVNLSELTSYLDRGDGICRHHNQETHLCTIYDTRPEICRVDKLYEQHFKNQISWQEFVEVNLIVCEQLNEMES